MSPVVAAPCVLVTGATGYVGGRLLRALEHAGPRVRCLARTPRNLAARVGPETEVVAGDCLDPATLPPALRDVDTAYYLVHSLGAASGDFEARDRVAARNFADAARAAGVRRIVYLGGLGSPRAELSPHLRSRQETGAVLRSAGVPVIELRASIILGSGSLSYELMRALVERLPVMLCPRWVWTETQPIAIEDVVAYLVAALDLPPGDATFEIGGADRVSYAAVMREYARQRGLSRVLVAVPVLTPRLSSLWLGLTTPVYARVGRALVEGLRNPTVVEDAAALRTFAIRPMGLSRAIERALANEDRELAATRWSDAISAGGMRPSWGGIRFGARLVDSRVAHVTAAPAVAFAPVRRIGGAAGWYYGNALWRLRGLLDLLVGGVGMRRGRRDPERPAVGDAIDCWRVEAYEPDRLLRLAAEMRLPGRAWLEFEVEPRASGSTIRQTAVFDPVGLAGLAYWYAVHPLHALVFDGMLRAIAARAEQKVSAAGGAQDAPATGAARGAARAGSCSSLASPAPPRGGSSWIAPRTMYRRCRRAVVRRVRGGRHVAGRPRR